VTNRFFACFDAFFIVQNENIRKIVKIKNAGFLPVFVETARYKEKKKNNFEKMLDFFKI